MKRRAAGVLALLACGCALAEDGNTASPSALVPLEQGYAFDRPEILVRQRVFGLAHGLSLLAGACLDLPEQAGATEEAYAAWHRREADAINGVVADLARHYYRDRAAEARWQDLVQALQLKDNIRDALGDVPLEAACASLPTALIRPRYELGRLLKEGFPDDPAATADAAAAAATDAPKQ